MLTITLNYRADGNTKDILGAVTVIKENNEQSKRKLLSQAMMMQKGTERIA